MENWGLFYVGLSLFGCVCFTLVRPFWCWFWLVVLCAVVVYLSDRCGGDTLLVRIGILMWLIKVASS